MQRRARRATRVWVAVGLVALLGVLSACVPPPPEETPPTSTTAPSTRRSVVVYGDSLVFEAQGELRTRLGALLPDGWDVVIRSLGGTAQCDFHAAMQGDAVNLDVDLAVIAFSGNATTPCMTARGGLAGRVFAYNDDANWAADFWGARGVPLVFVAGPQVVGYTPETDEIRNVYRWVAANRGVALADEALLFTDPQTGVYQQRLPCLVGECSGGLIQARALDGVHFCLSAVSPDAGCAGYASGVVRYAEPIVQRVAAVLGLPPPPTRRMVPLPTSTTSSTSTSSTTSTTSTSSTTTSTTRPPP